jgi:hypothetical protein
MFNMPSRCTSASTMLDGHIMDTAKVGRSAANSQCYSEFTFIIDGTNAGLPGIVS